MKRLLMGLAVIAALATGGSAFSADSLLRAYAAHRDAHGQGETGLTPRPPAAIPDLNARPSNVPTSALNVRDGLEFVRLARLRLYLISTAVHRTSLRRHPMCEMPVCSNFCVGRSSLEPTLAARGRARRGWSLERELEELRRVGKDIRYRSLNFGTRKRRR